MIVKHDALLGKVREQDSDFVVVATDGSGKYNCDGVADDVQIQAAIDSLGSTGGKVLLKKGTYVLSASITFAASNITIEGEGYGVLINFPGSTVATAFKMADTTQRSGIKIINIRITSTNSGAGLAVDASYFTVCRFQELWIHGVNGGISFNSNNAFYNYVENVRISCSGSGSFGIKFDTGANENTVMRTRILCTADSTGVIVNAHGVSLYDVNVESLAAVGIDVQANGHDCIIVSPYLELNVINLQVANNVEALTVIGGSLQDGSTNNLKNNGAKGLEVINTRLQYEQFTYREALNGFPNKRWVAPIFGGNSISATSQTPTVGRVYLLEFEVTEGIFADSIAYVKAATQAGNVTVGIYGPITTEETCEAAPLLIESASVAVSAGTNQNQTVAFTKTYLKPGRYYIAIEFDDATNTYMRQPNISQIVGSSQYYDRAGGYGALTNPCPAPTNSGSAMPVTKVRCASLTVV